jgi:hypothetical protein
MTRDHPYSALPDQAFWSRSVSRGFVASQLVPTDTPVFTVGDRVVSAGSCFASNIVPWIEGAGLEYVRTEAPPVPFANSPENLGYRNFSAAYGNIYTTRQLLQLLRRSVGNFHPVEDRWYAEELVIDPFRPGLRYPARNDDEFNLLTAQHLDAVRRAVEISTVFVITLGLTEAWVSKLDGAVYPAAPGTVAGRFDPERHEFRNFTVGEVTGDLEKVIALARTLRPGLRFVLTVSPVPLVATATSQHVLTASTYSKSVLRVAAEQVASTTPEVVYFPAYEIVTGPQAPESYFEADRRNVSPEGVAAVMTALLDASDLKREGALGVAARAAVSSTAGPGAGEAQPSTLSGLIAAAECDEVMVEF